MDATFAKVVRKVNDPDIDVVNCHAISPDQKWLAVCPNNSDIRIYSNEDGTYEHDETLQRHGQRVTGLSWSNDNRLLSCAEDRTAYVWAYSLESNSFEPVLVELRASRAGLAAAWAPDGQRFAVGLASKDVAVCHFDADVRMWISKKKIAKSKASVGTLAWHPSSMYLAVGSTDRRMTVLDVEEGESFGATQMQVDAGSWVNAVAFSPSGGRVAFVPHDSTVRFMELAKGPDGPVEIVQWRRYPFSCAAFLTDDLFVACGFDNVPVLFRNIGGVWQLYGSLDGAAKAEPDAGAAAVKTQFADAQNKFKTMTLHGQPQKEEPATTHSNTITTITRLSETRFSTSALDGLVVVWELAQ